MGRTATPWTGSCSSAESVKRNANTKWAAEGPGGGSREYATSSATNPKVQRVGFLFAALNRAVESDRPGGLVLKGVLENRGNRCW